MTLQTAWLVGPQKGSRPAAVANGRPQASAFGGMNNEICHWGDGGERVILWLHYNNVDVYLLQTSWQNRARSGKVRCGFASAFTPRAEWARQAETLADRNETLAAGGARAAAPFLARGVHEP